MRIFTNIGECKKVSGIQNDAIKTFLTDSFKDRVLVGVADWRDSEEFIGL